MRKEKVEVLVIGAGPSGSVAAAYLNKNGIKVKVVEKMQFPRLVVGESLIPRVMDHFEEAGLLPALEKEGFEKKWGARFIRGEQKCIFDFSEKYGEGWNWTWQVPRADFDNVIAREVQRQGVDIAFRTEVVAVEFEGSKSAVTVKDHAGVESIIEAEFIIDSSGYGRVLPRLLNLDAPALISGYSSAFTHVEDVRRPAEKFGSLITFDVLEREVWLWVIPFSNGRTSLGLVGKTEYIESLSASGDGNEILRKAIDSSDFYRERFGNLDFLFEAVLIKNYSCAVKEMYGPGFALTGNSSAFLDPVFSSGVAFATESGMLSAKLITRQLRGEEVDWEREYSDYMKRGIGVFSSYVKEWYTGNLQKLFFHPEVNNDVKSKICAVLAGYVWDETNPFVKKHDRVIASMAYTLDM